MLLAALSCLSLLPAAYRAQQAKNVCTSGGLLDVKFSNIAKNSRMIEDACDGCLNYRIDWTYGVSPREKAECFEQISLWLAGPMGRQNLTRTPGPQPPRDRRPFDVIICGDIAQYNVM